MLVKLLRHSAALQRFLLQGEFKCRCCGGKGGVGVVFPKWNVGLSPSDTILEASVRVSQTEEEREMMGDWLSPPSGHSAAEPAEEAAGCGMQGEAAL